ncbi:hypothetical protein H5410_015687 [Solanum commersonii]|uniref:Uncharacterized protein n=1 Tax=Solanum commersonii TaxID=4109 RepID=A0A9J5ZV93_SOLCO|nr:hypothetical protein H5410_015687 [Solanum commersonii]
MELYSLTQEHWKCLVNTLGLRNNGHNQKMPPPLLLTMLAYQQLIIKRCPQLHLLQLEGGWKAKVEVEVMDKMSEERMLMLGVTKSLDPPVCDQASPVHELHRSISQLGINIIWIHKR